MTSPTVTWSPSDTFNWTRFTGTEHTNTCIYIERYKTLSETLSSTYICFLI